MKKALKKCHDSAVGCDDIHYQILKHLPFRSLDSLLRIFNQIWHTGILPDSWKEAIDTPISKPGKDSTNPANYRLSQNYFRLPRQTIRENANFICLFRQDLKKY